MAPADKISLKNKLNITVLNNEEEVKDYEKDEKLRLIFSEFWQLKNLKKLKQMLK